MRSRWRLAAALVFILAASAQAQETTLRAVTVSEGNAAPQADVTGFGDAPLREVPMSATVIGREQIEATGARRLADRTRFDSSVSDAYNAPGYWDFLSVRGFTLDNRFNYRREGLPISAETTIALDDKERVEILKGTSGIQAGTSAPGGLVNYVVKRPTQKPLSVVRLEATSRASLLGAVDTFDYYDFRSENEKRRQDAAQLQLRGQLATGSVNHDLTFGLLHSRVRNRFQMQAYNFVGTGNVQGTAVVPADPTLSAQNTNRDERSLEFSVQDAMRLTDRLSAWAGLRHTRLDRQSVLTDGSEPTSFKQGLTTPWLALSYRLTPSTMVYGSWGQGIESVVVPNQRANYANAGQALPALKSRQVEVGLKGGNDKLAWQLAAFEVHRPMSNLESCARLFAFPCLGQNDGEAVHRGIESNAQWREGPWRLAGGVTLLDAQRRGSTAEPAINGQRPTNVPNVIARALAGWRVAGVPGLELQGNLSHEGKRKVLADGSIELPSWTTLGLAALYETKVNDVATTWTLAVDNVTNRRYWRESPTQFAHVYLYPGAPRSVRLTFAAAL